MPSWYPKQRLPDRINSTVAEDIHKSNTGDQRKHSNDKAAQDGGPNPVHIEAHLQAREPFISLWSRIQIRMSLAEQFR